MKPSLSYFPHSTNTFFERSIRKLLLEHQANGYLLYNYLKTEIFKVNGYYLNYDELLHDDISDWFKFLSKESVGEILNTLFDIGLFDKQIFADQKILTSASIQEDFVDIMKGMRRQYYINPEIRLLEYDYYESSLRIKDKDEYITKPLEDCGKLRQPNNNSSETFGRFKQPSEEFQKLEHSSEGFNCAQEVSRKSDSNYVERKEIKETKKLKIDNFSFSLEETEKLLEIFIIEKNFPKEEFEKFLNHYGRTGWVDKNGNKITDAEATARNWTQLNLPYKFFIRPEHHKIWREVWLNYKKSVGFDKAKYLLKIKPQIKPDQIKFICDKNIADICEANIHELKPILKSFFGNKIKLAYSVPTNFEEIVSPG
jgi:hypothetical protein